MTTWRAAAARARIEPRVSIATSEVSWNDRSTIVGRARCRQPGRGTSTSRQRAGGGMGRQSAFVREDAVRSARDVFWSEGYEGASMASLQRATGLNASSIYHAFGSKRGLFDAAIEDYLECVVRPGLAPLRAPEVAPD